jgi:hypothetical protein
MVIGAEAKVASRPAARLEATPAYQKNQKGCCLLKYPVGATIYRMQQYFADCVVWRS